MVTYTRIYVYVCVYIYMYICPCACFCAHMTYVHAYTNKQTYIHTLHYITLHEIQYNTKTCHTYIHTYVHAYIHAYIHTYYLHTCILTYFILTYLHNYILVCRRVGLSVRLAVYVSLAPSVLIRAGACSCASYSHYVLPVNYC